MFDRLSCKRFPVNNKNAGIGFFKPGPTPAGFDNDFFDLNRSCLSVFGKDLTAAEYQKNQKCVQ